MNLQNRTHLTHEEKSEISKSLQIFALEGIARHLDRPAGRFMFHGGTSISTVHGSPRWSEDLDFVIAPDCALALDTIRASIEADVQEKVARILPGSEFQLTDKGKGQGRVRHADPGAVMRWVGRWEHPSRLGVVKMKTEFYVAEPDIVSRYQAAPVFPENAAASSEWALPAATLETIWADKIMAMSARPVMKWRDVFDMGYVMRRAPELKDDALIERLEIAAESYRSDLSEVHAGLQRDFIRDIPGEYHLFQEDMRSWLTEEDFVQHDWNGILKTYHRETCQQIGRALKLISEHVPCCDDKTRERGSQTCAL